ncbi:MAG: acyl carrier protein, partial [Steroidobacteraceae bacterium]
MDVATPARHPIVPLDASPLLEQTLAVVRELAAELHPDMPGIARLGTDASIERDFGLDSLARVELALRIEQALAMSVPDATLAESDTVRDLVRGLPGIRSAPAPGPRVEARAPIAPG